MNKGEGQQAMGDRLSVSFDRSYWVVPGKLLAGCYPGDDSEAEALRKLTGLLGQGIRHFVNLMEPDECDYSGNPFNPYELIVRSIAWAMNWAVSFHRMPIGNPARQTL